MTAGAGASSADSGSTSVERSTTTSVDSGAASTTVLSSSAADASRNAINASYDSSNFSTAYATTDDALAVMRRAQNDYERAVAYLATHDTSTSENSMEQYRTRLAALDAGMETFGQALREAPQDPVLNQYYLATLGAREATLSKLGTVLPTGARLSRF